MNKISRALCAVLACIMFSPLTATVAKADPELLIKAGHAAPPSDNQSTPWVRFKEYVEKESNGRIGVEIYGSASMGDCLATAEKVQMGILQMHAGSTSNLTAIIPEWQVFELPYLVMNTLDNKKLFYNEDGTALEGPVYEKMNALMEQKGLKMVWVSPVTFRSMGITRENAHLPSQLEGMKIRVTASPIEREMVKAFGMSPTTMAFGEVYTGLQLGTIDGLGLGVNSMYANKYNEVLSSIIRNKFNAFFMVASINKSYYENLPDWAKPIVEQGFKEAVIYANAQWDLIEEGGAQKFITENIDVHQPTEAEWQEWFALAKPVYDEFSSKLDATWVKTVRDRLEK